MPAQPAPASLFPRQTERSAPLAEQTVQSGFASSAPHNFSQMQAASAVPLQAVRSASSVEQTGQSELIASFSQRVSQMHSAGVFPDTPDTSPLSWELHCSQVYRRGVPLWQGCSRSFRHACRVHEGQLNSFVIRRFPSLHSWVHAVSWAFSASRWGRRIFRYAFFQNRVTAIVMLHGHTSSQGCSNPSVSPGDLLCRLRRHSPYMLMFTGCPFGSFPYIRSPLYVPGDACTTPYGRRTHPLPLQMPELRHRKNHCRRQ